MFKVNKYTLKFDYAYENNLKEKIWFSTFQKIRKEGYLIRYVWNIK